MGIIASSILLGISRYLRSKANQDVLSVVEEQNEEQKQIERDSANEMLNKVAYSDVEYLQSCIDAYEESQEEFMSMESGLNRLGGSIYDGIPGLVVEDIKYIPLSSQYTMMTKEEIHIPYGVMLVTFRNTTPYEYKLHNIMAVDLHTEVAPDPYRPNDKRVYSARWGMYAGKYKQDKLTVEVLENLFRVTKRYSVPSPFEGSSVIKLDPGQSIIVKLNCPFPVKTEYIEDYFAVEEVLNGKVVNVYQPWGDSVSFDAPSRRNWECLLSYDFVAKSKDDKTFYHNQMGSGSSIYPFEFVKEGEFIKESEANYNMLYGK